MTNRVKAMKEYRTTDPNQENHSSGSSFFIHNWTAGARLLLPLGCCLMPASLNEMHGPTSGSRFTEFF